MKKSKGKYKNGPIGKIKIVNDFLPTGKKLRLKEKIKTAGR